MVESTNNEALYAAKGVTEEQLRNQKPEIALPQGE
jgi:hypothetical protein